MSTDTMSGVPPKNSEVNQYVREHFPGLRGILLSLSDVSGSGGDPSKASRKGKAPPLERGRGKLSPPASLSWVTARAWERRDKRIHSVNPSFSTKPKSWKNGTLKNGVTPHTMTCRLDPFSPNAATAKSL